MLVEILCVLALIAVGSSLVVSGIYAIRKSQQRITDMANRTAITDDFIDCLSRDVRGVATARVQTDDRGGGSMLVLGDGPQRLTYRFFEDHVEREAARDGAVAAKSWAPLTATVSVQGRDGPQTHVVVSATVWWRRTDTKDPAPARRFDFAVCCRGDLDS